MKKWMLVSLMLIAACAGSKKLAPKLRTYGRTARQFYERGMRALQKDNHLEAISNFTMVKRRFPYSRWAPLADLRIADTEMKRERYLAAIDAYKLFIKFHPSSRNVPYAQYQIALAHYKQGPGDWILLPPSYEKDLTPIHDALKEVKKFFQRYPGSGLVPKAKKLRHACERQLANHELYVARFYAGRDRWVAARMRLEHIRKSYPTMANDPEVLFFLGRTYATLRRPKKARMMFAELMKVGGKNPYREKASKYLKTGKL